MGNWTIVIQGNGVHNEEDLDMMAKKFVKELKGAGQHIISADVTADWRRSLLEG